MDRRLLTCEDAVLRADVFLAGEVDGLTRSAAVRLLAGGAARRGGKPLKKSDLIAAGDVVELTLPDPVATDILPEAIALDVCYEDNDVIVVNKPVGMVVHPAAGHANGTLVNALLHHCGDSLSGINGALRPGIVHRIDKNTGGLIIAAKHDAAHLSLAAQLADHTLHREYEAVTVGLLREDAGVIDAPIARHPTERRRMAVRPDGRRAVTHWAVQTRLYGHTHVTCRLETGRTHQIRVHMASIGRALLGDTVYGAKKPYPGLAGQCLFARRLGFVHPRTGETVTLEAPLPRWFEEILVKLRAME